MVVDNTSNRDNNGLYPWPFAVEVEMIQYFLRYKPGWWILHIIMISLTFYLGHLVDFHSH